VGGRFRPGRAGVAALASLGALVAMSGADAPSPDVADADARLGATPEALEVRAARMLERPHRPATLLARVRAGAARATIDQTLRSLGASIADRSSLVPGLVRLRVEQDLASSFAGALAAEETFAYVEPDYELRLQQSPNDPFYAPLQYALENTGQTLDSQPGAVGADIDAEAAWQVTTGDQEFVIAVIDGAIDWSHPDLSANVWTNEEEIPDNGVDDDANGYVDDVHGWDFFDDDNDTRGSDTHGTHVAGILGAVGNNAEGVAGVAQRCRIMPLRFAGAVNGTTSNAIDAIEYAVANGARLSNNSWGGPEDSQALRDAIAAAGDAGHLFVFAAGNSGVSRSLNPAGFDSPSIISVAATDNVDALWINSNFNALDVDLAAPGVSVVSAVPGSYNLKTGTSMAAPHVAGTAALIWSMRPEWSAQDVRTQILESARPLASLDGFTATGGRLDAGEALTTLVREPLIALEAPAPAAVGRGEALTIRASVDPRDDALAPGGVLLRHRLDPGESFASLPMSEVEPGVWEATAPGGDCSQRHEWFIEVVGEQTGVTTLTPEPDGSPHVALIGDLLEVFFDDAESDAGWSVGGDAAAGWWERGVPVDAGRADPPVDADASGSAWLTDNTLGPNLDGNSDVDAGSVTLRSPALDLRHGGVIDYAWWLNDVFDGEIGREDVFLVEVATDAGGSSWQVLRRHRLARDAWRRDRIVIGVEAPASESVRVRFTVSDLSPGDVVEAGLDEIRVAAIVCAPPCSADLNLDGVVDAADLSTLLAQWGGPGSADVSPSGVVDAADLSILLAQFGPCAP